MNRQAAIRGFTLLELLVVIVIIGVMVGAVSMTVGGNESRQLRDEAQRVLGLLEIASQQAILNGQELAVQFSSDGYQFLQFDTPSKKWLPIEVDTLRPRKMPEGIELSIMLEGQQAQTTRFGETRPSRALVLSSGEMTPFILTLQLLDGPRYELHADMLGGLDLRGPLQ